MSVDQYFRGYIRVALRLSLNDASESDIVSMLPFLPSPPISYQEWADKLSGKKKKKEMTEEEKGEMNERSIAILMQEEEEAKRKRAERSQKGK